MLYGSDRLPQELVRSSTTSNERRYIQKQLGRLPQERYDRLLRPVRGTSTSTTRSPTPRAERSTTSPRKRQKQLHNSDAYSKSSTTGLTALKMVIQVYNSDRYYLGPRKAENNSTTYQVASMLQRLLKEQEEEHPSDLRSAR